MTAAPYVRGFVLVCPIHVTGARLRRSLFRTSSRHQSAPNDVQYTIWFGPMDCALGGLVSAAPHVMGFVLVCHSMLQGMRSRPMFSLGSSFTKPPGDK